MSTKNNPAHLLQLFQFKPLVSVYRFHALGTGKGYNIRSYARPTRSTIDRIIALAKSNSIELLSSPEDAPEELSLWVKYDND